MSYLVDYHMHTTFSDGNDTYLSYLEQARKRDLAEIGFSDHITLHPTVWGVQEVDYPVLRENLKNLCNDFSEDVQVRFGLEVDQSLYGKWPNDEVYQRYFKLLQKAAKSGLFDIIGHFDLVKKFNCWPESDQTHLFDETLKVMGEANVVMELNTSGLDRPCKEVYPSQKIIELAFKNGVAVTLGSDAHRPEQVGRYFDKAIDMLRSAGYTKITRFRNRFKSEITI
jgi:histidinol-phosphatase (PHP family)